MARSGRKASHESSLGEAVLASAFATAWADIGQDDTEECDKTVIRAHSKHGAYLWMTPLILPVVNQLLTDLDASVRMSLEAQS